MKGFKGGFLWVLALALGISSVRAEDIDLFASGLTAAAADDSLPNIIFVLDNSSNWSRASQQWPDGTQGQSEVEAIKNTLAALPGDTDVNVALMEFGTGGSSSERDGGYVRFDLQSYQSNSVAFEAVLDTIYNGINDSDEKRDQNRAYGHLIHDVYNYLSGGDVNFSGAATPASLADTAAYASQYSVFDSPLSDGDLCAETYVIFISNPQSSGLRTDDSDNSHALTALYAELGLTPPGALAGSGSGGLDLPEYQTTSTSTGDAAIGYSLCYSSVATCDTDIVANPSESAAIQAACTDASVGCYCDSSDKKSKDPSNNNCRSDKSYQVRVPGSSNSGHVPNGNILDGADWNLDDWTKFLHEFGVPITVSVDGSDQTYRVPVTTYTLDVFQAKPNEEHSAVMDGAAEQGGGYRQAATSAAELEAALTRIFGDIIDINTSFAAVTLPLSATNRAQAENKVFVGMFRPASQRKPRWLGNLKQYQLALFNGQIELADVNYNRAINPQTGFAQSCATSFWTEDTSDIDSATAGEQPYFDALGLDPNPVSECASDFLDGRNVLSDSPDGPFVEKGGAAQQIRNQVSSGSSSNRTLLIESGGSLRALASSDFSTSEFFDYLEGSDPGLQGGDLYIDDGSGSYIDNPDLSDAEVMPPEGLRATIHGDIVHSRPLTISYGPKASGDGTEFRIFYGANDGLYRALDPDTGEEDWALIASEHTDGIERLYRNTPTINYYGLDASLGSSIAAEDKGYFFDGSTGAYTVYNGDNELTEGYIFPTMRRGGRMVYGLDISPTGAAGTPPSSPTLLWKVGCPNLDNDTGCTSGFSGVGQTWSTPVTGLVAGWGSGESPVVIFGGGWDSCLDDDTAAFPSGCSKGAALYVVDMATGNLIGSFATDEPVVAEVSPVDIDGDGAIDFVYAADAGGNLYRLSLGYLTGSAATGAVTLDSADWFITKIAEASSSEIRFMNKPVVGELGNYVFVTLGTGDRERPLQVNYPYDSDVSNRFYVFLDRPFPHLSGETDVASRASINLDGSTMLNAAIGLAAGETLLDFDGWYQALADRGEQIVNQSAISGGYVFFNSFQPEGGSRGQCSNLGTSKAYRIPLFAPEYDDGEEYGQGIPIPPIIVTVDLDSNEPSCTSDCGEGEITEDVVTVCIGCEGFDPIEIEPVISDGMTEAFRVENMDAQ